MVSLGMQWMMSLSGGVSNSLTNRHYPWCEAYSLDGLEIYVPFDMQVHILSVVHYRI